MAPFDGLVALRHTEEYNTVGAGGAPPVVRLHDMSEIRVEIDVPEVLFQQSGEDDAFAILARFPAQPDKQYPMSIREYDAQASEAGQSFRVTLGMEPDEDLVVLPGSSVEISVSLFAHAQAITLPATALLPPLGSDGDLSVMLFKPGGATPPDEGTVERRPVTVEVNNLGGFTVVEAEWRGGRDRLDRCRCPDRRASGAPLQRLCQIRGGPTDGQYRTRLNRKAALYVADHARLSVGRHLWLLQPGPA